jgi:hypothetical protein
MTKRYIEYNWEQINAYLNGVSLPARWVSELVKMKDDISEDCVSKCQLMSKYHTIEMMLRSNVSHLDSCAIVGSWYGQWAQLLRQANIAQTFTGIDIDPSCKAIAERLNSNLSYDHCVADMYEVDYTGYDLVINTSCEHIKDINKWLNLVDKNSIVVLHSNNYFDLDEHINCTKSLEEFVKNVADQITIYKAETLSMPMYDRHIIIGFPHGYQSTA